MTKTELRKIYLSRRENLLPSEIKQKSKLISDAFFAKFDLRGIKFLHCFLPIERFNEIDTRIIFERVWREFPHIETLLPRVNRKLDKIENLRFTPDTELIQNSWEIHEPAHDELVETEKIDVVLVPLLCFDFQGFRVGYGKGFYDKLLKNCRADCLKIGLSYFPPVENIAGINEFDVRLDYCLTPNEVWKF